ncbi:MAG: hypothetical protein ABI718_12925 [Acidobacteriota bacterium]
MAVEADEVDQNVREYMEIALVLNEPSFFGVGNVGVVAFPGLGSPLCLTGISLCPVDLKNQRELGFDTSLSAL